MSPDRRTFLQLAALASSAASLEANAQEAKRFAIAIHGGAGKSADRMPPEEVKAVEASLGQALDIGVKVLQEGGASLDAVEQVLRFLEDDPLFNAGRGAVFTAEGRTELDAAIMDGKSLAAGSIAGITRTRHPISLARRVMEKSPHVMLISTGADTFSKEQGLEQVEPGWFYTERRWRALEKFLKEKNLPIPPKPAGVRDAGTTASLAHDEGKKGTVGVAALDLSGNIAAGTSTGGTTGKRWGRVGDSPIIGAGTYASNTSCAVSATGTGEYFIRLAVAREICALVEYKGMKLQAAADDVVQKRLSAIGGDGGIIAVAPDGQMAWSFNTSGMYRARMSKDQPVLIAIYKDEK